jgi:hypothetical protein
MCRLQRKKKRDSGHKNCTTECNEEDKKQGRKNNNANINIQTKTSIAELQRSRRKYPIPTTSKASNAPRSWQSTRRRYRVAIFRDGSTEGCFSERKSKLLDELANAIGNLDTSDVFVISIWIGE